MRKNASQNNKQFGKDEQLRRIEPCPMCNKIYNVRRMKANNARRFFCSACFVEFFILKDGNIKIYSSDKNGKRFLVDVIEKSK